MRAGNVIGGGDFSVDRIVPDAVRTMKNASLQKEKKGIIFVRNPDSIRPYQHVLEPLSLYLTIAMKQYMDSSYVGSYNVGPGDGDCITTGELMDIFCQEWNEGADTGAAAVWRYQPEQCAPHEAALLKLDCSKAKVVFGWKPKWGVREAVEKTVEISKAWMKGGDVALEMERQIGLYFR